MHGPAGILAGAVIDGGVWVTRPVEEMIDVIAIGVHVGAALHQLLNHRPNGGGPLRMTRFTGIFALCLGRVWSSERKVLRYEQLKGDEAPRPSKD